MRRFVLLLTALLVASIALGACGTPLDEAGARKAATEFFLAAPHEGGAIPQDVAISAVKPATREGRAGWEVAINGRIVLPGLPEGYLSAMILFVDGATGAVTVAAQG